MSTEDVRTQAALRSMIEGKLLFQQTKDRGVIVDGYIFQVPGSPQDYCVLTLTSPETLQQQVQRVAKIECEFPHPGWLLREMGAMGKYQRYREISIESTDARRVLAMYRAWFTINALRYGEYQLPEPKSDGPDTTDLSIQFA